MPYKLFDLTQHSQRKKLLEAIKRKDFEKAQELADKIELNEIENELNKETIIDISRIFGINYTLYYLSTFKHYELIAHLVEMNELKYDIIKRHAYKFVSDNEYGNFDAIFEYLEAEDMVPLSEIAVKLNRIKVLRVFKNRGCNLDYSKLATFALSHGQIGLSLKLRSKDF